jgi:protein-L-isoaspartate(D-aspartate) O-methyltransferase
MAKEKPSPDENFRSLRKWMVRTQMLARDIRDHRVLAALEEVPRELFVPPEQRPLAFEDRPLPIGGGQTISQPYIVALMVQELRVQPTDRVLDVGAGSGYQTAVLSLLAGHVNAIERIGELAQRAEALLRELAKGSGDWLHSRCWENGACPPVPRKGDTRNRKSGDSPHFQKTENGDSPRFSSPLFSNVTIRVGDGTLGWPEEAPFDGIICGAAGPQIPPAWVEQLAEGGRIVAPVGGADSQTLMVAQKLKGQLERRYICGVRFVKLIGQEGWEE